ncbi:MAG: hypothetical protein IKO47_03130 [Ruminococcus sp.]|nr:hypothetical protein [Ruminococcus sp.]
MKKDIIDETSDTITDDLSGNDSDNSGGSESSFGDKLRSVLAFLVMPIGSKKKPGRNYFVFRVLYYIVCIALLIIIIKCFGSYDIEADVEALFPAHEGIIP